MIAPAIPYSEAPLGHPYEAIAACCTRTIDVDGEDITIHIMLSGAYNALGLIGTEMNGIVILNETHKAIVLDRAFEASFGWYGYGGPTKRQQEAFATLAIMPDEDLVAWIRDHERYRHGSL